MKTYIYTLEHPETQEVRYVGKTTNIKRRYYQHICKKAQEKTKTYVSKWILSLLSKGLKPIMTIIEEVEDNYEEAEIYWISQFKVWGFRLCNLTEGGEGHSRKHTEESKIRMSLAQKGKPKDFSEEAIESLRKRFTENNPMKSTAIIEDFKRRGIFSKKNENFSDSCKKRYEKLKKEGFIPRKRAVINTETGEIFDTVKQASDKCGVKHTTLIRYLKGTLPNKTKLQYYEPDN